MAFTTFGEVEWDAEIFRFRIGGGFDLDDDGVVLACGQRSFGNEEISLFFELEFYLAGGGLGGGGDLLRSGGLGLHGRVVKGDADGAVLLDEEFGLLVCDLEDAAFAGSGLDGDSGECSAGDGEKHGGGKETGDGFHGSNGGLRGLVFLSSHS